MASDKDEKKNTAQPNPATEVPVVSTTDIVADETATAALIPVSTGRIFRDNVFTSRTLIMPDGRSLPVSKGRVTALGDDQFEYLNNHPDLELLME